MNDEPVIKQFLKHQPLFMGYLMAMIRDIDAAEEVLQNVAVVILERAGREEIRDFHAWTKEIVRRQALHFLQNRAHQSSRLRLAEPKLLEGISRALDEDPCDPETFRRERNALRDCVRRLPGRSREMVSLRYEGRQSFDQIGENMSSTGLAVQRALSRIRKMLHECVRLKVAAAAEG